MREKFLLIVSQVELNENSEGLESTALPWLAVKVEHAQGGKCPRCWHWDQHDHADGLCNRCDLVLQ
jgi:isoleucyl-tRNA synthetase